MINKTLWIALFSRTSCDENSHLSEETKECHQAELMDKVLKGFKTKRHNEKHHLPATENHLLHV